MIKVKDTLVVNIEGRDITVNDLIAENVALRTQLNNLNDHIMNLHTDLNGLVNKFNHDHDHEVGITGIMEVMENG